MTEDELKELAEKQHAITAKLATVGSDIGLVVLSVSCFTSIAEGFMLGCFQVRVRVQLIGHL